MKFTAATRIRLRLTIQIRIFSGERTKACRCSCTGMKVKVRKCLDLGWNVERLAQTGPETDIRKDLKLLVTVHPVGVVMFVHGRVGTG